MKYLPVLSYIVILAALVLVLSGCGITEKIIPQTKVIDRPILHPSAPRELSLYEFNFKVFNREELEKFLEENSDNIQIITIDSSGYQSMVNNFQEMMRYIEQQKEIILYYRKVIPDIRDSNLD